MLKTLVLNLVTIIEFLTIQTHFLNKNISILP
jgi:hypothetical protein